MRNHDENIEQLLSKIAPWHGRVHILDRESAKESTGHGSPLPLLVHGGPGRAGGGEELGGLRAVKHYMQRTAIQGSPNVLTQVGHSWTAGAEVFEDRVHPFKKSFDELRIGERLLTARRTITEADIVNFGGLSGDYFMHIWIRLRLESCSVNASHMVTSLSLPLLVCLLMPLQVLSLPTTVWITFAS